MKRKRSIPTEKEYLPPSRSPKYPELSHYIVPVVQSTAKKYLKIYNSCAGQCSSRSLVKPLLVSSCCPYLRVFFVNNGQFRRTRDCYESG